MDGLGTVLYFLLPLGFLRFYRRLGTCGSQERLERDSNYTKICLYLSVFNNEREQMEHFSLFSSFSSKIWQNGYMCTFH